MHQLSIERGFVLPDKFVREGHYRQSMDIPTSREEVMSIRKNAAEMAKRKRKMVRIKHYITQRVRNAVTGKGPKAYSALRALRVTPEERSEAMEKRLEGLSILIAGNILMHLQTTGFEKLYDEDLKDSGVTQLGSFKDIGIDWCDMKDDDGWNVGDEPSDNPRKIFLFKLRKKVDEILDVLLKKHLNITIKRMENGEEKTESLWDNFRLHVWAFTWQSGRIKREDTEQATVFLEKKDGKFMDEIPEIEVPKIEKVEWNLEINAAIALLGKLK